MPDAETVADFFFLTHYRPVPAELAVVTSDSGEIPHDEITSGIGSADGSWIAHLPPEPLRPLNLKTGLYSHSPLDTNGTVAAAEIEVPEAPALPRALEIARSLRPFLKPFPTIANGILNEEETAEQSAHLRQLTLVFRPRRERWFDAALVVEDTFSMSIWNRTVDAFERMLVGLGAFRDVRRWRLKADATISDVAGRSVSPSAIHSPDGRRIVFIVTQGVSTAWQSSEFAEAIVQWGHKQPTAVLQLLPRKLWENTRLGEEKISARCQQPGLPNSQWDLELPDWMKRRLRAGVALPVLSLDPASLSGWAEMLMARANSVVPAVFWSTLSAIPTLEQAAEEVDIAPEDRIERFQWLASEDGFRLATALTAGPITLPILRLINQTLFGESAKQATLAEIVLGGLLWKVRDSPDPDLVYFDFHSGVRDLLSLSSHSDDRFAVRRKVTLYMQQHPDTTERFRALVPHKHGKWQLPEWAEPFADESEALLRACGLLEEVGHPPDQGDDFPPEADESANPVTRRSFVEFLPPAPDRFDHRDELEALNRAWEGGDTNLVQVVGRGGSGKTSLLSMWAHLHLEEVNIFWWSFDYLNAVTTSFFESLIAFLGLHIKDTDLPIKKVQSMASRLSHRRVALLLDCMELVQDKVGAMTDLMLRDLLHELIRENKGLVICSSRVHIADLALSQPHTALTIELASTLRLTIRDQRQMNYEMLPHARPGSIAGLLEFIIDFGGHIDVHRLADELSFEIDDLLPIVDAAELLGFVTVKEGIAITSAGREYAESQLLTQRESFRAALLEHVLLMRQITRALSNKTDHTVPGEFFLDMLGEQFSEEEAQRQLETAINWGRYADLFDFDASRGRFVLPEHTEMILDIEKIDSSDHQLEMISQEPPKHRSNQSTPLAIGDLSSIRDQRQMKYETLPHARPGGIGGLLELLIDHKGRADIYRLADDLGFEIERLFPSVEAAHLLDFLRVEERDAVITDTGQEYAKSEIRRQKELFRKAALEHVLLLRQITRALNNKSDHTVPEEFFLDMLDEQFSEEETPRQLETAINWARYAELFDFDPARRRFILPEPEEPEIEEFGEAH
jgi:hypothetical protein